MPRTGTRSEMSSWTVYTRMWTLVLLRFLQVTLTRFSTVLQTAKAHVWTTIPVRVRWP